MSGFEANASMVEKPFSFRRIIKLIGKRLRASSRKNLLKGATQLQIRFL
jgi:hypothetical protein